MDSPVPGNGHLQSPEPLICSSLSQGSSCVGYEVPDLVDVSYPGCPRADPPGSPSPPPQVLHHPRLEGGVHAPKLPTPSNITSPLSSCSASPKEAKTVEGPVPPGMEWVVEIHGRPEEVETKGKQLDNVEAEKEPTPPSPSRSSRPAFWDEILNKESIRHHCNSSPRSSHAVSHASLRQMGGRTHETFEAENMSKIPADCLLLVCSFLTMGETLLFSETCAVVWCISSSDTIWSVFFNELFCEKSKNNTVEDYVRATREAAEDHQLGLARNALQAGQVITGQGAVAIQVPPPLGVGVALMMNANTSVTSQSARTNYTNFVTTVSIKILSDLPAANFKESFVREKVGLNGSALTLRLQQAKQEDELKRLQDHREAVQTYLRHAAQFATLSWVILVLLILVCATVAVFTIFLHISPMYGERFDKDAPLQVTLHMFHIMCVALFILAVLLTIVLANDSYDVHSGGADLNKPTRVYKHIVLDVFSWCVAFALLTVKVGQIEGKETDQMSWSWLPFSISVVNAMMILDGMFVIVRSLLMQSHFRLKEAVLGIFIATSSAPVWLTFQLVAFSRDYPDKISCPGALIPTYVMLLVVGITAGIGTLHGIVRTLRQNSGRECVVECLILCWYSLGAAVYVGVFVFFVMYSCTNAELALVCLAGFMVASTALWWTLSAVLIK